MEVDDEGVLHLLEDVPLGLGVGRVLLVAHDRRLLQHLHGEDLAAVVPGYLAHEEHLAVAALAQDLPQLKVAGPGLGAAPDRTHVELGQFQRLHRRVAQKVLENATD